MSKTLNRLDPEYWEHRLFRNAYTYRGERREVSGWSVKIQWNGERRTVRLPSADPRRAAREAMTLYAELPSAGWGAAIEAIGGGRPGRLEPSERRPRLLAVGPRKYVSDLRPGMAREYFADLALGGRVERVALETEEEEEARRRAAELLTELAAGGWDRLLPTRSVEVTVAVFWQSNPMTCTYATLLSLPASTRMGTTPRGRTRGWRILVVEPDVAVRRALVRWLGELESARRVASCSSASRIPRGEAWDLVLANRGIAPGGLRARLGSLNGSAPPPRMLTHGLFADSDAIFASVSGVSRGYFLKRVPPARILEPLLGAFSEGPPKVDVDEDRLVRRYFQNVFEPEGPETEAPGPAFSARENQVLELLGRGLSDKEIANELGISVWTVHSHLKRIFGKYGVRTRTEAVVRHLQK